MPRTHAFDGADTSQNGDDAPNPPPVPPNLADANATLVNATADNTHLLHGFVQQNQNIQNVPPANCGHRNTNNEETTYVDFTKTRPPVFSKTK